MMNGSPVHAHVFQLFVVVFVGRVCQKNTEREMEREKRHKEEDCVATF